MNREQLYERREIADRMEVVMYVVTGVAALAGVFTFLFYSWLPGLGFLILAALAFGLARVFELLGDLFASRNTADPQVKARTPEGTGTNA